MVSDKNWELLSVALNGPYIPMIYNGQSYCPYMQMGCASAIAGVTQKHGNPFGAAVVKNGVAIAVHHNTILLENDPTCHAETNAIRIASKVLGTTDLSGCELYATGEPCPMCWDMCNASKIATVFVGSRIDVAFKYGFEDSVFFLELNAPLEKRKICATFGLMEQAIESEFKQRCVSSSTQESSEQVDSAKTMKEDLSVGQATLASLMEQALSYGIAHSDIGPLSKTLPFGAVIVEEATNKIIGSGAQQIEMKCDMSASAEISAIREACKTKNSYNLSGCYIVTTAEPSVYSYVAILWSRLSKIVVGIDKDKLAAYGYQDIKRRFEEIKLPKEQRTLKYQYGVMEDSCSQLFEIWKAAGGKPL